MIEKTREPAALHLDPGPESLQARAQRLVESLSKRAEQAEQDRMVPSASIEEMQAQGLFRAFQGKRFGGLEALPEDFFRAVVEIGTACPSASWILAIMGVHAFELAQLPLQLQEEIYADNPDALLCASYAPSGKVTRVPGGFSLQGQWRSCSGVDHASWAVVGAKLEEDAGTSSWIFHVPRPDFDILDDWHVLGLQGTGSKSIILDDVFIPAHRATNRSLPADPSEVPVNDSPLYRIPRSLIFIAPGGAPALGAVKGAYAEFLRQAAVYVSRRDGSSPTDDPHVQAWASDAHRTIETTEYFMMKALRDVTECVYAGNEPSEGLVARALRDLGKVADDCVSAMRLLFEPLGARAVYNSNPMQRLYRDILTARQHGTQIAQRGFVAFGRSEFGMPITPNRKSTP